MRTRINELKGRMADEGRRVTCADIVQATGIRQPTLTEMVNGTLKQWRPEYVDALCQFLGVTVGELLVEGPVKLPLRLNLRPDRRKQVDAE